MCVSSDAATSRGLRMGEMINGVAPKLLKVLIQNGNKRLILGSFNTKRELSPNSFSSMVQARS